jgi:glycosyltransferase involved in cell wall biosynthesis
MIRIDRSFAHRFRVTGFRGDAVRQPEGIRFAVTDRGSILVVGAGNLERAPDGGWVTKAPIAAYLHELADRFGGCVWLVQTSGTWGVALSHATSAVTGRVDPQKIRVVPIEGRLGRTPRNCLLVLRHLAGCRFAIFYLPGALTMVPMLPLARLRARRVAVYLAGDYELPLEGEVDGRQTLWGRFYRATFGIAMRLADVVIARGRYLAGIAGRFNRRVFETVPLGHMKVEACSDRDEIAPETPRRVLYMGLLLESKGLDDLLHALHALVERRPQPSIRLDLLGDGSDRSRFERLARELGLAGRVQFRGWVEDADRINAFIANSHVVVMPTSTHAEGVPRVIDEALIRRIPVVATRIAGVPDEFRDGEVLLVDPEAPAELADAIEKILFDPVVRRRYVAGAERRRRHWQEFTSAADQHTRILCGEMDSVA